MSLKSIGKQLHHLAYDDEPTAEIEPVPTPPIASHQPATFQHSSDGPISTSVGTVTIGQDDLYEKLKKNTSFEYATGIQHIFSMQKPLEPIIPDPVVRLKAAVVQSGMTVIDINHDLDKLENLIKQEADKIQAALQHERENIATEEAHATQLEQQLHDLRTATSDRKNKLDRADTGYASALSRRKNDLADLKNQFAFIK
jgi:hypothetical protein